MTQPARMCRTRKYARSLSALPPERNESRGIEMGAGRGGGCESDRRAMPIDVGVVGEPGGEANSASCTDPFVGRREGEGGAKRMTERVETRLR